MSFLKVFCPAGPGDLFQMRKAFFLLFRAREKNIYNKKERAEPLPGNSPDPIRLRAGERSF